MYYVYWIWISSYLPWICTVRSQASPYNLRSGSVGTYLIRLVLHSPSAAFRTFGRVRKRKFRESASLLKDACVTEGCFKARISHAAPFLRTIGNIYAFSEKGCEACNPHPVTKHSRPFESFVRSTRLHSWYTYSWPVDWLAIKLYILSCTSYQQIPADASITWRSFWNKSIREWLSRRLFLLYDYTICYWHVFTGVD